MIEKIYTTYESPFEGTYTLKGMSQLYINHVDKEEYPDFQIWLEDMVKSGVFEVENMEVI